MFIENQKADLLLKRFMVRNRKLVYFIQQYHNLCVIYVVFLEYTDRIPKKKKKLNFLKTDILKF